MRKVLVFILLATGSITSFADTAPDCLSQGELLPVNNNQVLQWKDTTKNQYHDRAHISGTIARVYADQTGHDHMSVQIGSGANQTVEVVYNEDFGGTPTFQPGAPVEACGDYITATQPVGHYPASPDGAIVHWVHQSTNPNHESGFLMVSGVLYGQLNEGGH